MAIDAINLPLNSSTSIRPPLRIWVLARAIRIGRIRRALDREYIDLELRLMNARSRDRGITSWIDDLVQAGLIAGAMR